MLHENILKLHQLVDQYLARKMNEIDFSDQFFEIYNIIIDVNDLTDLEKKVFDNLNKVVCDFIEYREKSDLSAISFTTQKLKREIKNIKSSLIQQDIYDDSDKHKLYWLIHQYIMGNMSESIFCDKFYYSYDLGVNHDDLNDIEKGAFQKLDKVVSRFSPYKEDHLLDPKAFFSVAELRTAIIEIFLLLRIQNLSNWQ